jgi:hypothetical protein
MEKSAERDQALLQQLYARYAYLQDYPGELQGMRMDGAVVLGYLAAGEFLGSVLRYPAEQERLTDDYYSFLSSQENLKLTHYCLLVPGQPLLQPDKRRSGWVAGADIVIDRQGSVLLRWGDGLGLVLEIIWDRVDESKKSKDLKTLNDQLYSMCERFLLSQGITSIITTVQQVDTVWYQGYLSGRGYRSIDEAAVVWIKFVD